MLVTRYTLYSCGHSKDSAEFSKLSRFLHDLLQMCMQDRYKSWTQYSNRFCKIDFEMSVRNYTFWVSVLICLPNSAYMTR